MVSLLIVDDSADFCVSAAALLDEEGFEVVGCVGTGSAAVEATAALHPAIVLLDVQLPDIDGFEVARRLAAIDPAPGVVLISSRTAASYGDLISAAPVRGFLEKVALSGTTLAAML
jgi:DNA-binding NarL/FixJ family response regulator